MFPLAFVAGWLQGHWWDFISRNYVVWPTFLLMNVFTALKGSHFWFLFVYDDCASHEAFFLLPKISMPYYIIVQMWTPFSNIRNIFYPMWLQMNVSFGTRAYCRNYTIQADIAETEKRKETGRLKWLHVCLYKEQLKWKGSDGQYFPLDAAVILDSRPMTGQAFPP